MKTKVYRGIILAVSIAILFVTFHTIAIGYTLASISNENINTESWRISENGSIAANNVYDRNAEIRSNIYNSPNPYVRWISTTNSFVQILVGLALIALSGISCFILYTYFDSKIRRIKRKIARAKVRSTMHKHSVIAR